VAESYLASHFLMRMGRKLDWTIEDSWRAYRDHFCVTDYGTTDFYWVKSQTYTRREMNKTYDHVTNRQELSFLEWILLHSGQLPTQSAQHYESALDKTFMDNVLQP
jgi:type IV secretory pathway VirD2 relaxase